MITTIPPEQMQDPGINHAIEVILSDYGDAVSVKEKKKDLLKFGRNPLVGTTSATIMTLPAGELNETYVASNLINSIISDSASDGEIVTVEGHTSSDGLSFVFVAQDVTLNGTTKVALGTDLARTSRVFNANGTDLVGNIYVTETDTYTAGVPDTDTKVHLTLAAGENQSEKASTTISSTDYWIVTCYYGDVLKKTSAFAEINLEMRYSGQVFRHHISKTASNTVGAVHTYAPYLIVPKNTDIRLVAVASGSSTDISGGIQGYLAKVV